MAVKGILAVVAALAIGACSADGASTPRPQPSPLGRIDVLQLLLRADQIKHLAFGAGTASLADAFGGRALQRLKSEIQSARRLAVREEERNATRTLVFWDPKAGEAVLQVVAERRLVTPDQPDPLWATTIRQWWARLQYADGAWCVVDQQDLAPDRWRRVAPSP